MEEAGEWARCLVDHQDSAFSLRQHDLTPLDLIVAETSSDLAMWTNDGRLAGDRNP